MKRRTLLWYLNWYYDNLQENIVVCYRPTMKNSWADRTLFMSDDFHPQLEYNHRSILENEVVIEYDEDDINLNKRLADKVCESLKGWGIEYSKWFSGSKSYHVHVLLDTKKAKNISLLKNAFMRYFGTYYYDPEKGNIYKENKTETLIRKLPDIRLAASNHLIRAEYGMNEKTQQKKSLIHKTPEYPLVSEIPPPVWEQYIEAQKNIIKWKASRVSSNIVDLKGFKYIASSHHFKDAEDGRERALFIMIHALKPQYTDKKEELVKFLQEWYKYSGGYKLSDMDILHKVRYHWKKEYSLERPLRELLESIGKEDLIE